MKLRFIVEPKGNNEFWYSTEVQETPSSLWHYVAGTVTQKRDEGERHFERILREGIPGGTEVLREVDLGDPTAELAERMAEENRINGESP